jgi:rhamnosyltransferase subunit B
MRDGGALHEPTSTAPPPLVALATLGTLGDLHPFIAVACALAEQGYRPVLASLPEYRERVEAAGIAFHPVRPSQEDVLRHLGVDVPELARRAMRDPELIFRDAVFPFLEASYEDLAPLVRTAALVLTHSLAYSARIAAEAAGVPYVAVVLQPALFLSAYDPPQLPGAGWLAPIMRRLGPRGSGAIVRGIKRLSARRYGQVNALRLRVGLAPSEDDPIFDGQYSRHGTIALYSPLLGRAQPDFPPSTCLAGFAFFDGACERGAHDPPLDPALGQFLAAGPPPIVFTLGSFAPEQAGDFYEVSAEAARRLDRRAVLLVGDAHRVSHSRIEREDLLVRGSVPFSRLFPHAAAVVHHGGIGTLAQALRAGKPQLIVPFFADQPDNAARAVRLGVARAVPRWRYSVRRATRVLSILLNGGAHSTEALRVAERVRLEDGAAETVRFVDRLLGAPAEPASTGHSIATALGPE